MPTLDSSSLQHSRSKWCDSSELAAEVKSSFGFGFRKPDGYLSDVIVP